MPEAPGSQESEGRQPSDTRGTESVFDTGVCPMELTASGFGTSSAGVSEEGIVKITSGDVGVATL